jgi:hypothetical protein
MQRTDVPLLLLPMTGPRTGRTGRAAARGLHGGRVPGLPGAGAQQAAEGGGSEDSEEAQEELHQPQGIEARPQEAAGGIQAGG